MKGSTDGTLTDRFTWNCHDLITRLALSSRRFAWLDQRISIVPLEDFLVKADSRLIDIVNRHRRAVARKGGGTAQPLSNTAKIRSLRDFLTGLLLNPDYVIPYVRAKLPHEIPGHARYGYETSSPYCPSYALTGIAETIRLYDVLCTFSDEPDWGMDQGLFSMEMYPYGPCPLNSASGLSSQICFHNAFFHDHFLVATFYPQFAKSFMLERIEAFSALADEAFRIGIPYWGWRLTAWALHYYQDLTQPYHARACPVPIVEAFCRLLRVRSVLRLIDGYRAATLSRHIFVEAAASYLLNQEYRNHGEGVLRSALLRKELSFCGDTLQLMKETARRPAEVINHFHHTIGLVVAAAYDGAMAPNWTEPSDCPIEELLPTAAQNDPKVVDDLLRILTHRLEDAGSLTRFVIDRIRTRRFGN
jgi:hypothetical protein